MSVRSRRIPIAAAMSASLLAVVAVADSSTWATAGESRATGSSSLPAGSTPGATGSSSVGAESTSAAPLQGSLLFGRTQYPDEQAIFLLTGAGEQELSDFGEYCCVLRVSPDRSRVLVMPGGDAGSPVAGGTIDLDGGGFSRLAVVDQTLNLVPGAWSPDGERIAFLGWDDADPSRRGLYTGDADTGEDLFRVTTRPGMLDDAPLDYSPDGTQIVFYRSVAPDPDPHIGGSLWVVGVDGSNPHRIAEASAQPADWARWSPDGERIVFGTQRTASSGALWTVHPDGTELTKLFMDDHGGFPIEPIWSPDGSLLLFALDPTNDQFTHPPNELVVIDADGTNQQVVVGGDDFKFPGEWWQ